MATQNAARAQKVEIVDEVKTRMGAASAQIVSEYRGLSVAELAELRTALEGVGADYRIFKNTLVLPGHRRRRLPAALGVPERPDRPDLRGRRHQRRGQGAARLLAGEPAAGDQGRAGRRLAPVVLGPGGAGRPAASRGASGPPGRCPGGAHAADGRPPPGPAPQLGLRRAGPDRPAGGGRRGCPGPRDRAGRAGRAGRARPSGRARGRAAERREAEAEAPAAETGRHGRRSRDRGDAEAETPAAETARPAEAAATAEAAGEAEGGAEAAATSEDAAE